MEFATIRERLIKIGARVIKHLARIRVQLPRSCPQAALFRTVALRLLPPVHRLTSNPPPINGRAGRLNRI